QLKIPTSPIESRFSEQVLPLLDPDGLRLELVFTAEPDSRAPAPSADVPAPHGIRGFHSATLALAAPAATVTLLTKTMGYRPVSESGGGGPPTPPPAPATPPTKTMGYRPVSESGGRARYTVGAGGPGTYVDILTDPNMPHGLNGAGTVHHIAFRVADDAAQRDAHAEIETRGLSVSPVIDRAYFKSIYYREPGGVLFEIATDQPGFTFDEPV